MTKLDIFNIALAEFGEPQVTDVDLEQQQDKSIKVLMQNYQIALDKASRESEWSWLEDIIELEEPIARNVGEFAYVYKLPEDVLQIISVEPEMTYRVIGTKIYCEEMADFAYAKLNSLLDESNNSIPPLFWYLVALQLALLSSASITNNNEKTIQAIELKYNQCLSKLRDNDRMYSERIYL